MTIKIGQLTKTSGVWDDKREGCLRQREHRNLLTLYIRFARKHSTSSISILELAPVLFPSLMAAANSATGILVRRRGGSPFLGSSKPPARKTLRHRLRKAMSRPRSRVRYIRRLTNSFSPASIAASNPARSPCLIQRLRGRKRASRRG